MAMGFLSTLLICLALLVVIGAATDMRFDSFNIWGCPKNNPNQGHALSETCDRAKRKPSSKFCMCNRDLTRLAETGNHYIAYSGNAPNFLDAITASGNELAWMVDGITDFYKSKKSGRAIADRLWKRANALYPGKVPKFWIINELSYHLWFKTRSRPYRKWALALITRLSKVYKVTPITCSPSLRVNPKTFKNEMATLAKLGYLGVEAYGISTTEIKRRKYNVNWLTKQYAKGLATYAKVGVKRSRIIMVDHYGATKPGHSFGRSGLTPAEWVKVIAARGAALKRLKLGGVLSYGWASYYNDTPEMREKFYDAYNNATKNLP